MGEWLRLASNKLLNNEGFEATAKIDGFNSRPGSAGGIPIG
jgi:hypothetical protein